MNSDAQLPSTYDRRASAKRPILLALLLANLLYSTLAFAQVLGTGQLNIERRSHTATLLENEKVLIIGGDNQNGMVSQAEIFDPVTQMSAFAAPLISARTDHTATRLPDNRVLLIGGRDQTGSLQSTEIYNLLTTSFLAGPAMMRARSGHTATILANDKILVTGGDLFGNAEIYDPVTQSFSLVTGSLNTPRKFHSAILLQNGQVMIVGGVNAQGAVLNTAEVFDPASQTFYLPPTDMQTARAFATLKLLSDGKVQIIGGDAELSMEVLDPTNGIFIAKALLPPNTDLLGATLSTQSRAALFSPSISQDPLLQGILTAEQLSLLDRADQSITELPERNQALVAGGVNSAGQVLNSARLVSSSRASVTTDKTDYAPGQIVTITGSGFQPNEQVDIYFHEFPEEYPDVFLSATANQQGSFVTADFAPQEIDIGRIFTLTAIGQSSGFAAQTAFKDDKRVTIAFAGSGSGTVTSASNPTQSSQLNCISTAGIASGTCQVNFDNNATLTLTAAPSSGTSIGGWNIPTGYTINSGCASGNTTCNFTMNNTAQTVTVTFNGATGTTTTVTSSANPSTYGQSLVFTATVSRVSGTGAPVGTVQFKINGVNLGSPVTLSAINTTSSSATSLGTTTLPVGTHVVTAEYGPSAGFNASSGTLTGGQVVKKLTIVVTPTANQNKTYGSADPTLAYGFAPALIGSDTFSGALGRDPGENVGMYNITQGTLALSGNYTFNFTSGVQFKINKRPITITADAKSKFYGDTDPALTYQITSGSLKSGDTITAALTRVTGENFGTYAISQGTLAISDGNSGNNYDLTFVGALLTINKRPITVTADATTKIYSESDPALTYQVTSGSLVFGDIFTGALSRVTGELVGTYAIQQGTLGLNNNYILTYIGANLTITTGFAFNGFHSPVGGSVENGDGGTYANPVKSFKLGSTIPVKFGASWLNGGAALITGIHTLQAIKYSNSIVSEPAIDATPTDAATTGNQFRLTSTDWHFNLSTKGNGFTAGTWLLSATLVDGSQRTVWISIKK